MNYIQQLILICYVIFIICDMSAFIQASANILIDSPHVNAIRKVIQQTANTPLLLRFSCFMKCIWISSCGTHYNIVCNFKMEPVMFSVFVLFSLGWRALKNLSPCSFTRWIERQSGDEPFSIIVVNRIYSNVIIVVWLECKHSVRCLGYQRPALIFH